MRSADPRRAELRNLMVDSALGGVWIAVMQFNLLPSVLLATMLSVDKVSVGGPLLLARTSTLLVAGCSIPAGDQLCDVLAGEQACTTEPAAG
jgi:diguanylate cyclase